HGGEVVAMTMGPPQAEEALRLALALGADRCVHLSDRVFALADTLGTSRTLALAIRKEGGDLVLCGRKTLDSETWQVPPEVAAFLGLPHVTSVTPRARPGKSPSGSASSPGTGTTAGPWSSWSTAGSRASRSSYWARAASSRESSAGGWSRSCSDTASRKRRARRSGTAPRPSCWSMTSG